MVSEICAPPSLTQEHWIIQANIVTMECLLPEPKVQGEPSLKGAE